MAKHLERLIILLNNNAIALYNQQRFIPARESLSEALKMMQCLFQARSDASASSRAAESNHVLTVLSRIAKPVHFSPGSSHGMSLGTNVINLSEYEKLIPDMLKRNFSLQGDISMPLLIRIDDKTGTEAFPCYDPKLRQQLYAGVITYNLALINRCLDQSHPLRPSQSIWTIEYLLLSDELLHVASTNLSAQQDLLLHRRIICLQCEILRAVIVELIACIKQSPGLLPLASKIATLLMSLDDRRTLLSYLNDCCLFLEDNSVIITAAAA